MNANMFWTLRLTITFQPIFHQNANRFTFGPRIGLVPKRDDFALLIPTCWCLKTLANTTRAPTQANIIWLVLGPGGFGLHWACQFHVVSDGIWAL